ncbi:hypothetical protein MTsPCn9_06600 [Croceitalea sp. MTPC9]|uniref:nucleotidyltransferase family protein n=1 Tax=unclassified Croceitalea TaxID=2632280 RepID=UPI002B3683EE|nr:hypothetical protein MTsPCn6_02110 [Croceitalea sp. MTPC6]GMN15724.1 hypothetical protein MTsPCn9_06600 [Croceitalea sp. MTPC9]
MGKEKDNIAVLILAAGASTRMGKIKQLLPWRNSTLLEHAVQQANQVSKDIFVVLGANANEIEQKVPNNVDIIHNPNWKEGMGSSISCGVSTIESKERFRAILIMLADQPLIDPDYLVKMLTSYDSNNYKIIATSYGVSNGVPAIFSKSVFVELKKLNKDYGARKLMERYSYTLKAIDPKGKEIDIDTPETYEFLKQGNNQSKIIKK